jgi:hypothetical protein
MSLSGTSGNYTAVQLLAIKNEINNDPKTLGLASFLNDVPTLVAILNFLRDGALVPNVPTPGNVVGGPSGAVTGATNVNPIVVTSTAHGLVTGDSVLIVGVLGNTAANGSFAVTKIDANTFSIPIAGNGAYTSGGTWTWCVTTLANGQGVRKSSVPTQQLIGAIAWGDIDSALNAAQLAVIGGLLNDGAVVMTNPDGTENSNAINVKKIATVNAASRLRIVALEGRFGSRIEQLLNLIGSSPGVLVTDVDVQAAAIGHY